ncbi:hypothetical protein ACLOJK_006513, partial [Asimina triloba]
VHCRSTNYGAPSSSTGHCPTHLRRGSDRLIGAVQKIGHEETMGVGEHRRRDVTLQAASQAIPITIDHGSSSHEPQQKIQQIMASGTISIRQIEIPIRTSWQQFDSSDDRTHVWADPNHSNSSDRRSRNQATVVKFETQLLQWTPVLLVLCSEAHLENHQAAPLDPSTMTSKGPAFRTMADCLPTISNVHEQTGQARLQRASKDPSRPNHPIPNSVRGQIARSSSEPNNPSRHRAFVHGVNDNK